MKKLETMFVLLLLVGCGSSRPTDLGYTDYNQLKFGPPISRPNVQEHFLVEPVRVAPSAEQGVYSFCNYKSGNQDCSKIYRSIYDGNNRRIELVNQEKIFGSILREKGLTVVESPDARTIIIRPILTEVVISSEASQVDAKNVGIIGSYGGFETSTEASFIRMDVFLVDPRTDAYIHAFHTAGTFSESTSESEILFIRIDKKERSLASDSLRLAFTDLVTKILHGLEIRSYR